MRYDEKIHFPDLTQYLPDNDLSPAIFQDSSNPAKVQTILENFD